MGGERTSGHGLRHLLVLVGRQAVKTRRRWVYRVLWSERADAWIVRPDGGTIYSRHFVKADAVADGRRLAREVHRVEDRPTQLVIYGRDGKIQSERTYGADPRRHKS